MAPPSWKLVLNFGENSEYSSRSFASDVCPCRYCWSEKCGGQNRLQLTDLCTLAGFTGSRPKWKLVLMFDGGSEFSSQLLQAEKCTCAYCWCGNCGMNKFLQSDFANLRRFLSPEAEESLAELLSGTQFSQNDNNEVKCESLSPTNVNEQENIGAATEVMTDGTANPEPTSIQSTSDPSWRRSERLSRNTIINAGSDQAESKASRQDPCRVKAEASEEEHVNDDFSWDQKVLPSTSSKSKKHGSHSRRLENPIEKQHPRKKELCWCRECFQSFTDIKALHRHSKQHNPTLPFKCYICSVRLETIKQRHSHHNTHRDATGRFKCKQCKFSTKDAANLELHLRIHSQHKPFCCNECPAAYHRFTNLICHRRIHTGEKPYKCAQGPKSFNLSKTLETHSNKHSTERPFKYVQLSKLSKKNCKWQGKQLVKTEVEQVEFEEPIISQPSQSTNYEDDPEEQKLFEEPYDIDGDEKKLQLSATELSETIGGCGTTVTDQKLPRLELQKQLPVSSRIPPKRRKQFSCLECGETFQEIHKLDQHLKQHNPAQPFQCCLCPARFETRKQKDIHQNTHKKKNGLYKCSQCKFSTKYQQNMSKHLRIHTGERPFKCDQCSRSFNRLHHLEKHKHRHSGEKSFKCDQSSMAFVTSQDFEGHKKEIHSREILLKSGQCSTSTSMAHLQKRKRIRSSKLPVLKQEPAPEDMKPPARSASDPNQRRLRKPKNTRNRQWCFECSKPFEDIRALNQHLKEHNPTHPFKCGLCSTRFETRKLLFNHRETHMDANRQYNCDQCGYCCDHAIHMIKHLEMHSRSKSSIAQEPENFSNQDEGLQDLEVKSETLELSELISGAPGTQSQKQGTEPLFVANEVNNAGPDLKSSFPGDKPVSNLNTPSKRGRGRPSGSKNRAHTNQHVKPYKCPECNACFDIRKSLDTHMKSHNLPFRCILCQSWFASYEQKKVHCSETHKDKTGLYKCNECVYSSERSGSVLIHMRIHSGETPYKCDKCPKAFAQLSALQSHNRACSIKGPRESDKGSQYFPQLAKLVRKRVHSGVRPFKCNQCAKSFNHHKALNAHKRVHVADRRQNQNKNPTDFTLQKHFARSKRRRPSVSKNQANAKSPVKPQECPECSEMFESRNLLDQHMESHNLPFQCNLCSSWFASKEHKNQHFKTHKDEKGYFKCSLCVYSTKHSGNMFMHTRVHSGERPFKCDKCPRSFTQVSSLQFHKRTHSGQRPVNYYRKPGLLKKTKKSALKSSKSCTSAKTASNQLSKNYHQATDNSSEPKFSCSLCASAFKTKKQKDIHVVKKHQDDDGRYKCQDCAYSCHLISEMVKHMETHALQSIFYKCALCEAPFTDLKELARHDETVHLTPRHLNQTTGR